MGCSNVSSQSIKNRSIQSQIKFLKDNMGHITLEEVMGIINDQRILPKRNLFEYQIKKQQLFNELEYRDRLFFLQYKNDQTNQISQSGFSRWIYELLNQTISVTFNYILSNKMTINQGKLFISKNIIRNLASLTNNIAFDKNRTQQLNKFMSNNLLPYIKNKFPLNSGNQINKKLIKQIKEVDNFQSNQNDYILKSKITFDINQRGLYNSNIMKFLNQIIQLPNKKIKNFSNLYQDKKNGQNMKKQAQKQKDNNNIEEIPTYYEYFESFFTQLFQSVYDFDKMASNNNIYNLNINSQKHDKKDNDDKQKNQSYRQQVKSYTYFAIGRKISANTQKFSEQSIQSSRLNIKSPAILRILVKWSEQLWKKFNDQAYFLNSAQRFYYVDKRQGFALNRKNKQKLQKIIQQQKQNIEKSTSQLLQKYYQLQALVLNQSKNQEVKYMSNIQFQQGYFATINVNILQVFLIKYLNILIHGLTKSSLQFLKQYPRAGGRYLFTTFKIGDIIRCKFKSKEKQVLYIYKQIQKYNDQNPKILNIIRLKNRLSSNTRDILINIKFCNQVTAQIQLAIDANAGHNMHDCIEFNHFIYELQRSKFGPISQISLIWSHLSQQSNSFLKYINQSKRKEKLQNQKVKSCKNHQLKKIKQNQFVPFLCSLCHRFQIQDLNLIKSEKCNNKQCEYYYQCGLCRLNILEQNMNQDDIKNEIFHDQQIKKKVKRYRLLKNSKTTVNNKVSLLRQLSIQFGIAFNKYHHDTGLMFFKVYNFPNYNKHIITIKDNQKQSKLYQKSQDDFIQNHIIYETQQQTIQKYLKDIKINHINDINKLYRLPSYFKDLQKKQKRTLLIEGYDLSVQEFLGLAKKWSLKYRLSIEKMNLQSNKLSQIQRILELTPSVKELIINSNMIQLIDIPESANKLQRLSITQNVREIDKKKTYVEIKINPNMSNAYKLKYLNIGWCQASQLPENISIFTGLRQLLFQNNKITKLSSQIFKLKQLQKISFNGNKITQIDEEMWNLENLQVLRAKKNKLKKISKNIKKLQKLTKIRFDQNELQQVPEQMGQLINLTQLTLSKNKLKLLPQSFQNLTKLKTIQLQQNNLQQFPLSLCNLKSIQSINLSKNKILSIPKQINHLKESILVLKLSQNIINQIPKQVWQLKKLQQLILTSNKIIQIPNNLKSTALKKLFINKNQLKKIPDQIIQLENLQELNVQQNYGICQITYRMKYLKKLEKFSISKQCLVNMNQQSRKIIYFLKDQLKNIQINQEQKGKSNLHVIKTDSL